MNPIRPAHDAPSGVEAATPVDTADGRTAADLMGLAWRGRHSEAIDRAEEILVDRALPAEVRIQTLYVLSVAALLAGRMGEALEAANSCYEEAAHLGSVGWKANALAMRAQVHAKADADETALADLVEAEVLMEGCTDLGLRSWGHAAIGTAYLDLRLFELALPHLEQAASITEQPVDVGEGPLVSVADLARVHLRWAGELERVGLDLFREEHDEHLSAAREWITKGEHFDVVEESEQWAATFARMRYHADSFFRPDEVVELIALQVEADLAAGLVDEAIRGKTHRARALRLLDRVDEAIDESRGAVALFADDTDVVTRLNAYHQLHEAQNAADVTGAGDAHNYILINAALLWHQRVQFVDGVKARRDLAVLEAQHEFSSRLAREDALTGAYNRRALDEWLEAHPAGPATLVMIDLDRLKAVNDAHGHSVGDEVLIRVAQRLTRASRQGDVIARIGGDEFVIAIDGGVTTTYELCRRIEGAIAGIELADLAVGLHITASIGAASVAVGQSTEDLLKRAERDMMESKRALAALGATA